MLAVRSEQATSPVYHIVHDNSNALFCSQNAKTNLINIERVLTYVVLINKTTLIVPFPVA